MPKIILASGPVIIENNKVLLVKHGDDFWKFCGGKAKNFDNESLKEISIREAKEETGLDVKITDNQPFFFFTKKESSEGIIDVVLVHFSAKGKGEVKLGKDIEACQWFDINNLPTDIAPNIKPAIKYFAK